LRRVVLEGARQAGLSRVDGEVAQVDRIPEHDGLHRAALDELESGTLRRGFVVDHDINSANRPNELALVTVVILLMFFRIDGHAHPGMYAALKFGALSLGH